MATYRTTSIFERWGEAYLQRYRPGRRVSKIIRTIGKCRTPALGGRVISCQNCGYQHYVYQSCGNRNCPICPALKKEHWLLDRRSELLPGVTYFHLVFTVPHELNALFMNHGRMAYNLLLRCANRAYQQLLRRTYGELQGGMVAIVHTWGQNLSYHPHVHCIVPGGGWCAQRQRWVKAGSRKFLVDVKLLSAQFKKLFLASLIEWWEMKQFPFAGSASKWEDLEVWRSTIQTIIDKDWVVYAKAPTKGADQVLEYLSRYVHRVAFSESRILEVTEQQVHFGYKDYRLKDTKDRPLKKSLRLDGLEFLRRFTTHVLAAGFQRIRYYGIWSQSARPKLQQAQQQLAGPQQTQVVVWSVRYFLQQVLGIDPDECPQCKTVTSWSVQPLSPKVVMATATHTKNRAPPTRVTSQRITEDSPVPF